MPQCTNTSRVYLQPYGRGSLHSDLVDVSFKAHQRANKVNECEVSRLRLMANHINRTQEIELERQKRMIERMRQNVEKFEAYKSVLKEVKISKLRTLRPGFKMRDVTTPETRKRCNLETRLYFAGFSMRALEQEVNRMIDQRQPHNRRGTQQRELLAVAKRRSDYVIDRKLTNEAIKQERLAALLAHARSQETLPKHSKASFSLSSLVQAHESTILKMAKENK